MVFGSICFLRLLINLNQKFLLDPPLPIKTTAADNKIDGIDIIEQTEVEVVDDNIGGLDKSGGYVENRKFTSKECRILKLLSNRFELDELQKLVNVDSHALSGEFQNKWGDTMKLIGEPLGSNETWGKSLRWASWIIDNYDYVSSTGDGFCDIEKPLIRYPSIYEIEGNDSGWERIYRSGYIEVPAFDADDAYERAENYWFDYEPEMETSDYGDYESDDDLELERPKHIKTLREQQLPFNPDNKNIEREHPKGEPDWSIRRGRQHYAMNVEDIKSEPVTALNNYLVKNSPFNFLGFDYYLTAVPGRMPNQANVDIFVPMLDTGYNADKLWTTRFSPVVNLCSPIVNVLLVGPDVTLYSFTLESFPVDPDPTATSIIRIVASRMPVPTFAFVKSTNNRSKIDSLTLQNRGPEKMSKHERFWNDV